ncbi:MAG TPA: hypothetical protein VE775_01320 [Pyrinomonadaceae bacterium]|nr:hypothetical protein [Pyrinomonadaceae bacterium]
MATTDRLKITPALIAQEIERGIDGADAERITELELLLHARRTRERMLKQELERLSQLLPGDSPRLAALANKLDANAVLLRNLLVDIERNKVGLLQVDEKTFALHGFVRHLNFLGRPKLTVALYDANGRWLDQLGYAHTTPAGYFLIKTGIGNQSSAPPGYLRVTDESGQTLHVDTKLIVPRPGRIVFREIIISGEVQAGTPAGGAATRPPAAS